MKQKHTWLYNQRPIPTKRMTLTPMSVDELNELIARETDTHLKQAYTEMRDCVLQYPDQALWHTAWCMTQKDTGEMLGDIGFHGVPVDKTVEIGYGVLEQHRGKGYTTEAVRALADWAFTQTGVYFVRAITDAGNEASEHILEKLKFKKLPLDPAAADLEEGQTLWELEIPASMWMAIFMCIGMGSGSAIGSASDNYSMGMVVGMSIGLAIGSALDAQDRTQRKRAKDGAK
ncbi:MAG: GNAT family N-acetyltransferase [Clostridiaceae bacterium]